MVAERQKTLLLSVAESQVTHFLFSSWKVWPVDEQDLTVNCSKQPLMDPSWRGDFQGQWEASSLAGNMFVWTISIWKATQFEELSFPLETHAVRGHGNV